MTGDLSHLEPLSFRCADCGESIEAEGNDPWELLLTSHYCPQQALDPA